MMKLIKKVYTPVDQQGDWLDRLNIILSRAIQAEMYLDDDYNYKNYGYSHNDQGKTIVIYALLSE